MEEQNRGRRWSFSCQDQERYVFIGLHLIASEARPCCSLKIFNISFLTNQTTDTNCLVVSGSVDEDAEIRKAR